ncbi:MAG: biotin/lipoyl-containing protein [Candidatus Kapaibacterium sp.]|jgi:biotin carboxyl carrier protein
MSTSNQDPVAVHTHPYSVTAEWESQPVRVETANGSTMLVQGDTYVVSPRANEPNVVDVTIGTITVPAVARLNKGTVTISMQGYMYSLQVSDESYAAWYAIVRAGSKASSTKLVIKAPMPGLLKSCNVQVGQAVRKGENLLVLEAMKMENVIKSTAAGTVVEISAAQGTAVEKGVVLCVIDTAQE